MNEEKKEKVRGSLASRILLTALIFLVVPLLALSFLLYIEDGRIKSDNNLFTLDLLMKKKIEMVETLITHERNFLSGIGFLLSKIETPQELLNEVERREGVSALFHLKKGAGGEFLCDISSDGLYQGRNFTSLMQQSRAEIYLVLDLKESIFFLTNASSDGSEAWVTALSLSYFKRTFPIDREIIYPAVTSLLTESGRVVFGSDDLGEKSISLQRSLPQTNFSLRISAPQAINFVPLPYFLLKVGVLLASIILLGGGGALYLTSRLSKPLKRLIQVISKVGRGELTERYTPDRMGFEFNVIGEMFNETVDSLSHHMEEAEQERAEKERYLTELKIGEEVQNSILPKELPKFPGLDIAVRFIAAKEVGGDFYDFLENDRLMLSIADTSGKGISACLYSLSVRSMLRSYGEIHQDLDLIVNETNNLFCLDTGDTGVFVTAFVAFFDPKTKELHYTNCGHFPALLLRKEGSTERLTTQGMALGVAAFEQVSTKRVVLESGDLLVLYTDGVVEAHNAREELFREERLIEFLEKKRDQSPQQIVDELIEEVALFAEGTPQHDDITFLVLRIQ
ncbi:MAG: Phosphoserine phosphatase RsbU [Chlamydiae bacterium]|nr:Phosphoserine phosphatase RsbU [Chlamydiota bacterium]